MSVVVETTLGDITVDLLIKERPRACQNFLKLCQMKYYNYNLFHTVSRGFIAQTGDPTGSRKGGSSAFGLVDIEKRYFEAEMQPRIKHTTMGLVSFVGDEEKMIGSQFFFTLGEELTYLDGKHCIFGEVVEGLDVLELINEAICDQDDRPYKDIRITHTVVLYDPLPEVPGLRPPSRSPSPSAERLQNGRIAPDEDVDETQGKTIAELNELIADKEAKARATILEMIGDLPDADVAPPENVLFVCKLNPVTSDDDLEIIFSRFGKIKTCEVIRDRKSNESLQYAFVEFEEQKSCEEAYFKMDNVLIDDRRIHVDFSQSVSRIKWLGKGRGVQHFDDDKKPQNGNKNNQKFDRKQRSRSNSSSRRRSRNAPNSRRRSRSKSPQKDRKRGPSSDKKRRSISPSRRRERSRSNDRQRDNYYSRNRRRSPEKRRYNESKLRRSRSHSPKKQETRQRNQSPPSRLQKRRSKSVSPKRRRSRSNSPRSKQRNRSQSPPKKEVRRSRSRSPRNRPTKQRSRSKGPRSRTKKQRSRSKSPVKKRGRSRSPKKQRSKSQSPQQSSKRNKSTSPRRSYRKRSRLNSPYQKSSKMSKFPQSNSPPSSIYGSASTKSRISETNSKGLETDRKISLKSPIRDKNYLRQLVEQSKAPKPKDLATRESRSSARVADDEGSISSVQTKKVKKMRKHKSDKKVQSSGDESDDNLSTLTDEGELAKSKKKSHKKDEGRKRSKNKRKHKNSSTTSSSTESD